MDENNELSSVTPGQGMDLLVPSPWPTVEFRLQRVLSLCWPVQPVRRVIPTRRKWRHSTLVSNWRIISPEFPKIFSWSAKTPFLASLEKRDHFNVKQRKILSWFQFSSTIIQMNRNIRAKSFHIKKPSRELHNH